MPYTSANIVPRRIFLDTGTFQAITDCMDYVLGEDPMPKAGDFVHSAVPQVIRRSDGQDILESLREIFAFDERAQFDWVVSPASLSEIDAAGDHHRSGFARDMLDHTWACLSDNPPSADAEIMADIICGPSFGNISAKDRKLLIEAAAADCDTFLTIEKRLPRQAHVFLKRIPILVATPMDLWDKLRPHIRGL